jgi:hypothetical protein
MLQGGTVDHRNPIPPEVAKMYGEFCRLRADKERRDRLGELFGWSAEECESGERSGPFADWALMFDRIEREARRG